MITKPIGFDNWRPYYFVGKDGSPHKFWVKGSFLVQDAGLHKVYRGANITATSAAASVVVTTAEPHGLAVGDDVRINGMPTALAALNAEYPVLTVPSTTTFTVAYDSTGKPSGTGIVGQQVDTNIPTAAFDVISGRLCIEDHLEPWELPWEG